MRNIILSSILLSQFSFSAFAKTQTPSNNAYLNDVVKGADTLKDQVSAAVTPGAVCKEVEYHLNRKVLIKDEKIPVIVCRPETDALSEPTGEDYSALIRDYNIGFHPDAASITGTRDFRLFVHELRKFPPALMNEMAGQGGRIKLIVGNGVSEDPEWDQERIKKLEMARKYRDWYNKLKDKSGIAVPMTDEDVNRGYTTTTEGERQWDVVSGGGGIFMDPAMISPTRIVINRMYRSAHRFPDGTIGELDQGATNLFLHEHGHALDNLYGHHTISGTPAWKKVLEDPQVKEYVKRIFSTYENEFEEEGFAEAFAYYHSCEASRTQMETHAPALAQFFKDFKTVREFNPAMYADWKKRNKQ
jgi:hypothetical protein